MQLFRSHVLVCGGTNCTFANSEKIIAAFDKNLVENKLENEVKIVQTGCFGLCEEGPIIVIYPEGTMYFKVDVKDVQEIVQEHLLKGRLVSRLLQQSSEAVEGEYAIEKSSFFKKQMRVALRNCGVINPELIDEYIAFDGYKALGKALTEMKPMEIIKTIKDSGLRGRGGGGFPTGTKWEFAAKQDNEQNTSAVMLMKAIPERLWTEVFWKAIPILLSKQWPSPDTQLEQITVLFMSGQSIRSL